MKKPPVASKEVKEKLKDPEKYIPSGVYCYGLTIKDLCPFQDFHREYDDQMNGYCHYLKQGDWMTIEGWTLMLWDQVKECGINDDVDE